MKEYVLSVCLTAAAVSLIRLIAPKSRREVNFIAGLCVILSVLLPLGGIASDFDTGIFNADGKTEDFQSEFYGMLDEVSRENVQASVGNILESQFDILPGNYTVYAETERDGENTVLTKITVILTGRAIWSDSHEIARYIESAFGCGCEIAVG